MAVSNKAAAMHRRGLLGLSVLAVILTMGVGILLWQAVELSDLSQVSARIDQVKPLASGIRLVFIVLVAGLWPRLVHLVHRSGCIDEAQRENLLAQRWRLVGWLMVIEFVLGQDLLGRFLATINGPVV